MHYVENACKAVLKPVALFGFGLGFMAVLLSACDHGEKNKPRMMNNVSLSAKYSKANAFDDYLSVKHLVPRDEKQRESMRQEYLEREALAKTIEAQKFLDANKVAAEVNEFRKEMLISRYFDQYLKDAVTDQAVLNYYNSHAADYETKKVRVAHILWRTHQQMDEATRKAKLTTAQEAYSKINAGEDFAEIARAYSEDAVSSKKGGDLGWLAEGAIDKQFSKVIFGLEKGAVSQPFETPFGFHVVKLIDGPNIVKQSFDTVKGKIRHQLRVEAKNAELKRLLSLARAG